MMARMTTGALLLVLATGGPAWGQTKKKAASTEQGSAELLFQLAAPNEVVLKSVLVEMTRRGKKQYVTLSDDGSVSGDQPHDGVWMGRFTGAFVKTMTVRVYISMKKDVITSAYEGIVNVVDSRHDGVSWRLERGRGGWLASPTAAAYPGRHGTVSEVLPTVAVFGWGLFLVAVVALLFSRRLRQGPDPSPQKE